MSKVWHNPSVRWLILAFVIGSSFRLVPMVERQYFKGDEMRAYLAATGHEGEYRLVLREHRPPLGEWALAEDWLRLIRPEPGVGLWAIAQDLAFWDVHPPLYFWALYLWSTLFGVNFWSGAVLNLVFELVTLGGLLALGLITLKDRRLAQWAAALWWLNPTTVRVSSYTRAYILLTLIAVLFVYLITLLFARKEQGKSTLVPMLLLGLVLTLGLLTHYLFLFVIATSVIVFWLRFQHHRLWLAAALLLPVGMAIGTFLWLHPDFFWAFTFLLEPKPDFWSKMDHRLLRAGYVTAVVYSPLLLAVLLPLGEHVLGHSTQRQRLAFPQLESDWRSYLSSKSWVIILIAFALLPVLATDLSYVLLIIPHHAMAPHYLNFATPFVLILAVLLFVQLGSTVKRLPLFLLILVLLNLVQLHPAIRNFGVPPRLNPSDLQTSGVLLFDNPDSVHWFDLLLHMDDEQAVYVDRQQALLAATDRWLPLLSQTGGLYVSFVLFAWPENPARAEGREAILALIQAQTKATPRARLTPLNLGEILIYEITPTAEVR
jgi:hypothetical protein